MLRAALDKLSFDKFVKMSNEFLKTGRFLWFVNGNISKDEVVELCESAVSTLDVSGVGRSDLTPARCTKIGDNRVYRLEQANKDKDNENSGLISYYQYKLAAKEENPMKVSLTHEVLY